MWVRLDDGFYDHPKARAVGKDGRELYIAGLCRVAQILSDGFIPDHDLPLVAAKAEVRPKPTATRLVTAGLWEKVDGGWLVHDYHDYNPTAEAEREKRRKRAEAGRKGGLRSRPPAHNGQAAAEANASANAPPNAPPVAEATAQPEGQPSAQATAEAKSNPVPVFPLGNTTGQQQQTAVDGRARGAAAAAVRLTPAERQRVFADAVEALVIRLGKHETAATKDQPEAWLESVRAGLRADHRQRAHALLVDDPTLTPEQLAAALVPPITAVPGGRGRSSVRPRGADYDAEMADFMQRHLATGTDPGPALEITDGRH
jgi:hypothetical protein